MERILEFSGNHPFLVTALVVMIFLVAFHEFRRRTQGASSLSTADAVRLINRGAVVVDVRDAAAFAAGHIVNARHHPAASLKDNPESLAKLRKKTLLLVCDTAMTSGRAAGELRQQGFEQVFSLRGGLNAWRQENLPLVKDQDKPGTKPQSTRSQDDRAQQNRSRDKKRSRSRSDARRAAQSGPDASVVPDSAGAADAPSGSASGTSGDKGAAA